MGRWKASLIISDIARISKSINPSKISSIYHPIKHPYIPPVSKPRYISPASIPRSHFINFRSFSAISCPSTIYGNEYDDNFDQNYVVDSKDDEESGTIPVRAFFLCTSIDLKSMQAENSSYVVPPSSRSSNYIALRFCKISSDSKRTAAEENVSCCQYMVVYQYGSAVLFNMEDREVDSYLEIVRRHAHSYQGVDA